MLKITEMNDHCTALVAASADPGAGRVLFFQWKNFANAKRYFEKRSFITATLTRGKVIGNRDELMSQLN